MTIGRLIICLDTTPTPSSRLAIQHLIEQLQQDRLPTFAIGLTKDVTLSLTAPYDEIIYNAYEFIDVYDEKAWCFLDYTEIYLILNGLIYQGQGAEDIPMAVVETLNPLVKKSQQCA